MTFGWPQWLDFDSLTGRAHAVGRAGGRIARCDSLESRPGAVLPRSREPTMTQCDSAWWIRPLATLVGALVRAPLRAPLDALMRAAAFIGLLLGLTLAPADRASAQGAVKSVHGDWQIRCDTPRGAESEQCALMQSVT